MCCSSCFHVGFIVAIVFLKIPRENVYFGTSVSYVLMFFSYCYHDFEFEWFVDVFSCVWEGFSLPGDAWVVVFPQEYECFGENPAEWHVMSERHVISG